MWHKLTLRCIFLVVHDITLSLFDRITRNLFFWVYISAFFSRLMVLLCYMISIQTTRKKTCFLISEYVHYQQPRNQIFYTGKKLASDKLRYIKLRCINNVYEIVIDCTRLPNNLPCFQNLFSILDWTWNCECLLYIHHITRYLINIRYLTVNHVLLLSVV